MAGMPFSGSLPFVPRVVAVMVTGKSPERAKLAEAAVRSYQAQTYTEKRLLIINDGEVQLFPKRVPEGIVELLPKPGLNLGQLRNLALDWIYQELGNWLWVMQWDDDDWYHPHRISQQVAALTSALDDDFYVPGPVACTLRYQLRYDFGTNTAFIVDYKDKGEKTATKVGIPGSILHPPITHRYEAVGRHEDSRFLKKFGSIKVIENDPLMYLRLSHGRNTWDAKHIMQGRETEPNVWHLSVEHGASLCKTLHEEYGLMRTRLNAATLPDKEKRK